jgi:acetyl/propionyl-CoA carboxylase alpha subunit
MPSPGRILHLKTPAGPGVRDDGGYDALDEVPIYYDSLISKLTAWGETRGDAIARLRRAISEYEVAGIRTTLPFFRWLLQEPAFLDAEVDTTFLDRALVERRSAASAQPGDGKPFASVPMESEDAAAIAAALHTVASARGVRPVETSVTSAWTRTARLGALR